MMDLKRLGIVHRRLPVRDFRSTDLPARTKKVSR
jgi:hypothetical protein